MTYDLAVSAFSLLELPSKEERLKTIDTLWKKTEDFLVLIENGTFEGFMALMEARDFVIEQAKEGGSEMKNTSFIGQNLQTGHVFAPVSKRLSAYSAWQLSQSSN